MGLPRLPAATVALFLAALAGPAGAAIYKCREPGGAITYQQTPCPAGGGAVPIRAHQPSAGEVEAARQRGERDMGEARALEDGQAARRQAAQAQAEHRRQTRQVRNERCANYLEEAEALEERSDSRSKEGDRRRDARRAEKLRERHFSECFAAH
jgi:hypothetical protein